VGNCQSALTAGLLLYFRWSQIYLQCQSRIGGATTTAFFDDSLRLTPLDIPYWQDADADRRAQRAQELL